MQARAVENGKAPPLGRPGRRAAATTGSRPPRILFVAMATSPHTARWIEMIADQGWDLINMTGAPEAALAREMGQCYASLALVTAATREP